MAQNHELFLRSQENKSQYTQQLLLIQKLKKDKYVNLIYALNISKLKNYYFLVLFYQVMLNKQQHYHFQVLFYSNPND